MKRWSKLQKRIYNLIDPQLDFQLHCIAYPMRSQRGSTDIPRYYITLGKVIIWDYPYNRYEDIAGRTANCEAYYTINVSEISELIDEYIETPKEELFDKIFLNDRWGLSNILKAADRRIGNRRLKEMKYSISNAVQAIILARGIKG